MIKLPAKLTAIQRELLAKAARDAVTLYGDQASKMGKKAEHLGAAILHQDCVTLFEIARAIDDAKEVELK